jgi:lambda family phage tail tape measure protein
MAKQIEDIIVRLGLEKFEGLDKIRSSFRDLSKVTKMSEQDIIGARDSIFEFAKTAGNSEAVTKGLVSALQGLRSQADMCGDAYEELRRDIENVEAASRGYTAQAVAQRASLSAQYGAITNNTEALRRQRTALIELQQATRGGSQLFTQLGTDIQRTTTRLEEIEGIQRRTNATLNRGLPSSSAKIRRDLQDVRDRISLEQAELERLQTLTAAERRQFSQGTELRGQSGVTRAIAEQERILATFRQQAGALDLSENVRQRRQAVRDANALFMSPDFTGTGSRTAEGLTRSFGDLPNTLAGINQGLSELRNRLDNTTIGTTAFTDAAIRAAAAQRELREATQGVAAAFVQQLRTGDIAPSLTNLREVISSVRTEQGLLDTSSTGGARAFQLLERQARSLERQLSALQATQASLAATPVSGFREFSQSITPQVGDAAVQGSIRRNRERQERERRRLESEAADFYSSQPTVPLLLPAAGQTTSTGRGMARRRLRMIEEEGPEFGKYGPGVETVFGESTLRRPRARAFMGLPALPEAETGLPSRLGTSPQAMEAQRATAARTATDLSAYRRAIREAAAANIGSVNSLNAYKDALENMRSAIAPTNADFGRLTKRIEAVDTQIEKLNLRTTRGKPLSGMQLAQGVGAALSGGIFGGPEGLLGGLGGLALGGVGGAFAGAAAGAQVGMFRQQLGATTDYSARIDKLQIALRGIVGSQDAYNRALAAADSVTRDLNIPQEVAIQGMTRLSAAVKGAGGTVSDSAFAFRAVSEAVKATGGNAEQADGALLALTQVFSKGKVSAEELNQIAERLPGTFTLFAKAAGMTGPQLQKALQEGQVGLNDLMKFLQLISTEYGQTALKIAASSQEAGARLSVAMKNMQLEVGRALQPIGASLQSAFAEFITTITPSVVAALKGIAAAFEFLIENKTASGLATFALQLGAVTLGLIGLKAALEGLATIKVLALLTSTASAVKITGDVAATSALSVRGLSAALAAVPGFGWVAAGTAALGLLGAALYDNNKDFKTWVDSFLYIIKTDFESAWKIAVDIVKTNVKVITDTWEAAKNILTNTAGALVTSFDSTFNGIFSGILKRWQSLPEPLRKAMAQGGAQTIGMVLAPGNPVIGRLIGTGIRATQERPPVALADTGRYVPASAQQRFPGQLSILPSPATDEEKKKKAAKDKADRERQAAAAEQQRLANTLLDQQLRAADRVFQHQIELDRQRYELQKRLDDAQAQNRILRETGAARDIVSNFEDLQRSLREIEERRVRAVQDVRLAKQTQQSAAVRATFEAQGAAALSSGAVSGAMRQGIYRQGSIGPTSTGPHFDIKRVDGTFFNRAALDAYVRVNGKPLSSGVTVPGGRFGAPRAYGSHAGWDYAFPRGAALSLTGGARFTSTRSNTAHGDETAFVTPDGKVYKILHGKFEPAPRTTGAAGPSTSVRMPAGAAAQQNRAIRASGGAVIEGLDVNKAEAQLQLVEDNAAKERATLFEQFTLKATDALRQQNATMRDSNELQTLRNRLTLEGVRPEFVDLEERLLGIRQEQNQAQTTYNQLVKANPDRAAELQSVLAAENEQYAERARLLRENAEAADAFNKAMRTRQDERIGLGLREGAEAYVQSIGTMREATAQLAQTGIKGVEDAIFSLTTTGKANFQEFAKSVLESTSRMIIQQLILRSVMQIIGAIGGGSSGGFSFSGAGPVSGASVFGSTQAGFNPLAFSGIKLNALGNAYAANGIVPFAMGGAFQHDVTAYAMGGVVDQPTMFKFADGGAGRLGLMGEAGPEAIMPLRRLPNGRLGVEQAGGGAPVTVNVSVDATGTSVQGNAGQGEQLGRVISQAVQAELVRQQRPGGLLSR